MVEITEPKYHKDRFNIEAFYHTDPNGIGAASL